MYLDGPLWKSDVAIVRTPSPECVPRTTSRKANHIMAVMVQNGSNISNTLGLLLSLLPSSTIFVFNPDQNGSNMSSQPQDCMAAHRDLRVTSGNVSPLTAAMACLACHPEPNYLNLSKSSTGNHSKSISKSISSTIHLQFIYSIQIYPDSVPCTDRFWQQKLRRTLSLSLSLSLHQPSLPSLQWWENKEIRWPSSSQTVRCLGV